MQIPSRDVLTSSSGTGECEDPVRNDCLLSALGCLEDALRQPMLSPSSVRGARGPLAWGTRQVLS